MLPRIGREELCLSAVDPSTELLSLAEAAELLGISTAWAQELVDRELLGPARADGRVQRVDVVAYERRRQQRLVAVARVTEADLASGVDYR